MHPRDRLPFAILIIFAVFVAAMFGYNTFIAPPVIPTPTPTRPAMVETRADWYRLYFTTPELTANFANPTGGIPEAIIASFNGAQKTIDVAVYEIDWEPIAQALLDAIQRGVQVRLVTDTDYLNEDAMQKLRAANVPVVDDQRGGFMHDKFAVIDGQYVWAGSMNFSQNDAYRNNNNLIEINSTRLAENYTAEFNEMFEQRSFGLGAGVPHTALTINGTDVENYFSPDDGVAAKILPYLQNAQTSVYFLAFSFTRLDFAEALIDRSRVGVTVQGVFEKRQVAAGGDAVWNALQNAGLAVREDGNPYNMHHKVFIIDEEIVVLGSYNFSKNAEETNDENILIIHNADIAQAYLAEWQKVWDTAGK